MWGTAVHGVWCGTRTWPTRCPSCSAHVFFFMCNCGSKVFFDELDPPWPLHDCDTSWTRKLKRTTDKTGKITVELRPGITVSRLSASFGIDESIISRARKAQKNQAPDPIVAIEPKRASSKSIVGVLREITRSASPIKFYKLDETVIVNAMLDPIGAQAMGRITVHVPSLPGGQLESFSLWIPSALLKESRIARGITVSLTLEGIQILGRGYAWFSDDFEVVG